MEQSQKENINQNQKPNKINNKNLYVQIQKGIAKSQNNTNEIHRRHYYQTLDLFCDSKIDQAEFMQRINFPQNYMKTFNEESDNDEETQVNTKIFQTFKTLQNNNKKNSQIKNQINHENQQQQPDQQQISPSRIHTYSSQHNSPKKTRNIKKSITSEQEIVKPRPKLTREQYYKLFKQQKQNFIPSSLVNYYNLKKMYNNNNVIKFPSQYSQDPKTIKIKQNEITQHQKKGLLEKNHFTLKENQIIRQTQNKYYSNNSSPQIFQKKNLKHLQKQLSEQQAASNNMQISGSYQKSLHSPKKSLDRNIKLSEFNQQTSPSNKKTLIQNNIQIIPQKKLVILNKGNNSLQDKQNTIQNKLFDFLFQRNRKLFEKNIDLCIKSQDFQSKRNSRISDYNSKSKINDGENVYVLFKESNKSPQISVKQQFISENTNKIVDKQINFTTTENLNGNSTLQSMNTENNQNQFQNDNSFLNIQNQKRQTPHQFHSLTKFYNHDDYLNQDNQYYYDKINRNKQQTQTRILSESSFQNRNIINKYLI